MVLWQETLRCLADRLVFNLLKLFLRGRFNCSDFCLRVEPATEPLPCLLIWLERLSGFRNASSSLVDHRCDLRYSVHKLDRLGWFRE